MNIHLSLYGGLKKEAESGLFEIPNLEDGATVRTVVARVTERYPSLRPHIGHVVVAVDDEIVSGDATVRDGARVDLLPPVCGG